MSSPSSPPPFLPQAVTDLDIVWGVRAMELLPPWDDIPDEFKNDPYNPWVKLMGHWFSRGLCADVQFYGKDGVSPEAGFRHISAIMVSFAPKHQHKQAGCAYLASLWFEKVTDYEIKKNE